ncbi:hypothetical protein [Roseinatronobacter sp.]|uniref:hypothetical protein n=1 Tax=Roseinatronobacter sp. TaxID=1945755 RepID=UPI003F6F2CFE
MQDTEFERGVTSSGRIIAADVLTDLRAIRQLEGVFDGLDGAARAAPARRKGAVFLTALNVTVEHAARKARHGN